MTRTFVARSALVLTTVFLVVALTDAVSSGTRTTEAGMQPRQQFASPTPRPVTNGGLPVVSPRGKKITFVSDRGGTPDLFVINADGTRELQLTHTPEPEGAEQWSADGKQILFSSLTNNTSHIFAIDPDGKNQREIGSVPGRAPTLSPDGQRWLYMAGTWTATRLMVSDLDGSNAKQLTDGSSIAWNNHWSPDGKRIAFTGRDTPQSELAVFVMNADGSSSRKLTNIPLAEGGAQWPVWSPDGRRLAIQVNSRLQKNSAHIWIVDVATGRANKLAAHSQPYVDETPSWFPDGKQIAFQSNRTGKMEVWVMKTNGQGARQVTGLPPYMPEGDLAKVFGRLIE